MVRAKLGYSENIHTASSPKKSSDVTPRGSGLWAAGVPWRGADPGFGFLGGQAPILWDAVWGGVSLSPLRKGPGEGAVPLPQNYS